MPDVSVLEVLLYGEQIGTLTLVQGTRTLFAFNKAYIDNPERPTLSLSFKDQFGKLLTDIPPTNTRVPPFFANLLPEGPLREYLAKQAGVRSRSVRQIERLCPLMRTSRPMKLATSAGATYSGSLSRVSN
jgi:serine/threonine-protein kinase HipA